MFVFQVQVGEKGQSFPNWKANQLKLCEDINQAFLKKDAETASKAYKALADNIRQKYGTDYEFPELNKLGDKIITLEKKWTVPPVPQWFALKTALGKLEEPKPAAKTKTTEFVQDTTKTKQTSTTVAPKEEEPKPNTREWLGMQSGIVGATATLLREYASLPANKTLSNAAWNELKANAKELAESVAELDAGKLDKAGQDKAATLAKYFSALNDQLNKWQNLTKQQAAGYAKNMEDFNAILRQVASEPKEAEAPAKKEKLQQKVKVIPLDIVAGARQHMMSLNEDSGSDFRAKGLKMDTAAANQRFNFAIAQMAKYDGLDVTTTIGKGNRLLLSKEGEERLASLSEKERSVLFAIADMVAIRGEGNTRALLEKLTGGAKWSTDELLAALWHEGESLAVKEMGLKDKASVRFWSEHFRKVVSGLAAEAPNEEKPAEKQEEKKEAPEKEAPKAEERELRKFGTERIKFRELERQIPAKELKPVEVPPKPPIMEEEAKPEGRAVARTAAKSFTPVTSQVEPVSPKEKKETVEAKKPEVVVKVGEEEEEAAAVVPVTGTWVDRFSTDKEIQEYCGRLSAEQKAKAAEWIKQNAEGTIIDKDRIGALSLWTYAAEMAK